MKIMNNNIVYLYNKGYGHNSVIIIMVVNNLVFFKSVATYYNKIDVEYTKIKLNALYSLTIKTV